MRKCLLPLVCMLLVFLWTPSISQATRNATKDTAGKAEDEKRVKEILNFLQYMLNTIGSNDTPTRDKEVMITESYAKIFRDDKVQVEDDLDAHRIVITNKDVVSYLKDVDFFFRNAKFEFVIEDITSSTKPDGGLFYKVSARRILNATTSEGHVVTNTIPRYIEINYDPVSQDLKIASMYTNEFDQTAALRDWWKGLSFEWKSILKKKLSESPADDSLTARQIQDIATITSLDLSNNRFIRDIEPAARLFELKHLDLSGTSITDLSPIRNLTQLESLDISHTKITDLSPLRYAGNLQHLDLSHTPIRDISVIEHLETLQSLNASSTTIMNFSPVSSLTNIQHLDLGSTTFSTLTLIEKHFQLTDLDLSGTKITDLSSISLLTNLVSLDVDSTYVADLEPLQNLKNLKVLEADYTSVTDLMPLKDIQSLEKIYADYSDVTKSAVATFNAARPSVRVIFNSEDLKNWWNTLPESWQASLRNAAGIGQTPTKEDMAKVALLDSLNIAGNRSIYNLEPLDNLQHLRVLIANNTRIKDLSPLRAQKNMEHLDISNTEVTDISVLKEFKNLEIFRADNSKIEDIEDLALPKLQHVYADNTPVHDIIAQEFLTKNPDCLIVYKTNHLDRWWGNLSPLWKELIMIQLHVDTTRESLHKFIEQEALQFENTPVSDLEPLSEFVRLKTLKFSGTSIHTIPSLDNLKRLTVLHAANNPIMEVRSIGMLDSLEDVDISNTPVKDLKQLDKLEHLKRLNCSGTRVKRLDPLENLAHLEYLDCSNTNVRQLDALDNVPIKQLICYNTRISSRTIEKFKQQHPDCKVVHY